MRTRMEQEYESRRSATRDAFARNVTDNAIAFCKAHFKSFRSTPYVSGSCTWGHKETRIADYTYLCFRCGRVFCQRNGSISSDVICNIDIVVGYIDPNAESLDHLSEWSV